MRPRFEGGRKKERIHMTIKTVSGDIRRETLGIILPHEHIFCASEVLLTMGGASYFDKEQLFSAACAYLSLMKKTYGLGTFLDCTPVNLGRDIDLLRRISEESGVHIIASTGFYHTEEPLFAKMQTEKLAAYTVADAQKTNAGAIKCAVEEGVLSPLMEKILRACAMAHRETKLPIIMHTNAKNQNARQALPILFSEGVSPRAVTVGHLSDTDDLSYLKEIAAMGVYVGFDRLYDNRSEAYIEKKVSAIRALVGAGHEDQILLSHDALFLNGFDERPTVCEKPRFAYLFECILPRFSPSERKKLTLDNPCRMLCCQ